METTVFDGFRRVFGSGHEMQAAFGLRREESIKFAPSFADRGDSVVLKPSWTKGGKAAGDSRAHCGRSAALSTTRTVLRWEAR